MNEKELKRLEDLCAKATPEPWDGESQWDPKDHHRTGHAQHLADRQFIGAARTALPAALAEIRRLRVALQKVEERNDWYEHCTESAHGYLLDAEVDLAVAEALGRDPRDVARAREHVEWARKRVTF